MSKPDTGIINIHGKEYQTVALRVKQFRETHPDWTIFCEIIERTAEVVVLRASILDDKGRLISTGHAEEYRSSSSINKTSALENSETSAIGRALAFFGMGGTEIATADELVNAIKNKQPATVQQTISKEEYDLLEQYRGAAAKGMETLVVFHGSVPKGRLKSKVWLEHSAALKAIAEGVK